MYEYEVPDYEVIQFDISFTEDEIHSHPRLTFAGYIWRKTIERTKQYIEELENPRNVVFDLTNLFNYLETFDYFHLMREGETIPYKMWYFIFDLDSFFRRNRLHGIIKIEDDARKYFKFAKALTQNRNIIILNRTGKTLEDLRRELRNE